MKRFLLFSLCIIFLIAPTADAAVGSKGLIVNQGVHEIEIYKGEKKWLFVQDGLTKLPLFKGVCFYSDNTIVATVGLHSGVLRGNSLGTAHLSVVYKNRCVTVTVRVVSGKKLEKGWLLLLFLPAAAFLIFLLRKEK